MIKYIFTVFKLDSNSELNLPKYIRFTTHSNSTRLTQIKEWMYRTYLHSPYTSFYLKDSAYFKREAISDISLPELELGSYSQIIILDLSHSIIGPQGAKYLASEILRNLTALNLAFNNLGPEGAKYISFKGSHNLITLNLAFNNLLFNGSYYISRGRFTILKKSHLRW